MASEYGTLAVPKHAESPEAFTRARVLLLHIYYLGYYLVDVY